VSEFSSDVWTKSLTHTFSTNHPEFKRDITKTRQYTGFYCHYC